MAKKKNNKITIRSSAVEYLTYIAATGDDPQSFEMRYEDENIWLSQRMLATLYDVEIHTINEHISKIYADNELVQEATIRNFRMVQTEGVRQVKGFAMDDERLKNGGTILTEQYFEEQLQRVREIRLSERKFYQKITDIYSTAIDYDINASATKRLFATVQNKLHWSIHGQTASEVIYTRAVTEKEHMRLITWKDAPYGKIQKFDVSIAKNYLSEFEMGQLQRLVSAYLDIAEDMALRHIPMAMLDWETRFNRFIQALIVRF